MPSNEKIIQQLHNPYFKKRDAYIIFTRGVFVLKLIAKKRPI